MRLYIYEHCPYCVKARMIFGLKSVPIELEYLLNNEEVINSSEWSKTSSSVAAR